MKRTNDKRTRLVNSADQLFHQQGINSTTLANIAQLALVPLGNVYYYFKSKESIVLAVIEYRLKMLQQIFDEFNPLTNPKDRIKGLIEKLTIKNENILNFGDPVGNICLELSKNPNELHQAAVKLMQALVAWTEAQFTEMGKANANQLAMHLISNLQGISVFIVILKNENYLKEYYNFLINWVNEI